MSQIFIIPMYHAYKALQLTINHFGTHNLNRIIIKIMLKKCIQTWLSIATSLENKL
jgi:hypothetical protein